MDLQLEGKNVLITGGSKGIGLSCAKVFSEEGARLVLVSRDEATLRAAAEQVGSITGGEVVTHAADLTRDEERAQLAERFPDVDILVNNAGAAPGGDISSLTMDRWRSGWDLKVLGFVHLTKLYLEQMSGRGRGAIVNVIGSAGRARRADYICGATGNASLIAFTEAIGGQSPEVGVRVVGVNPGFTATERFMGRPVGLDELTPKQLHEEFPTMRVAPPAAVADVVAFLASDRAQGLSGVVVDCDMGHIRSGPTRPAGQLKF